MTAKAPELDGRDRYVPFRHGARTCPRVRMGIVDIAAVLFCVLRAFELTPTEGYLSVRLISTMA